MKKKILVYANPYETKVAVVEKGDLAEFHMERTKDRGVVGDIYKGTVVKVLPGIQAAFIEIGLERTAFLHVSDIYEPQDEFDLLIKEDDGEETSLYTAKPQDEKPEKKRRRSVPTVSIEKLLKEGQQILVQVAKEPLGTKGARLTSHISLPGRHLVLMPTHDHIGVSRRIGSDKERRRLKDIVQKLRTSKVGFIIRTACGGRKQADIKADMDYLLRLWNSIQGRFEKASAPASIYQELDLTLKTLRDLFTEDVDKLIIDSKEEYEKTIKFVNTYLPDLKPYVELHEEETSLFDLHGIEVEISEALKKKVWLKSGGYLVFDQTEALTTIDVNTGKYVGRKSPEETVLKTNLEAVKEVVYQLRLRNIGGIIIIDFIDMEIQSNRDKVYRVLREAVKKDKSQTYILKISELGLVEMTRKRVKESLRHSLCGPCPYCEGKGFIKSKDTIILEIYKELLQKAPKKRWRKVVVQVNPEIAYLLCNGERNIIEDIEKRFRRRVAIKAVPLFHQEEFKVT
ncbi:MAG: ribonuclease E/G [Thermodesulfobacteriota bacterium]